MQGLLHCEHHVQKSAVCSGSNTPLLCGQQAHLYVGLVGLYVGDVGLYVGLVGLYVGLVGLYVGLVGLYIGLVGLYVGDVGLYVGLVGLYVGDVGLCSRNIVHERAHSQYAINRHTICMTWLCSGFHAVCNQQHLNL